MVLIANDNLVDCLGSTRSWSSVFAPHSPCLFSHCTIWDCVGVVPTCHYYSHSRVVQESSAPQLDSIIINHEYRLASLLWLINPYQQRIAPHYFTQAISSQKYHYEPLGVGAISSMAKLEMAGHLTLNFLLVNYTSMVHRFLLPISAKASTMSSSYL